MEDFSNYEASEVLKDGSKILIRAVQPNDKAMMKEAAHHLSDRSSYLRFFRVKHDLTEEELVYYCEADFVDHVGLSGILFEDGEEHLVAASRYIVFERDPRIVAEMAFAVDDPHQGLGIGRLMLKHLVKIARKAKVDELVVSVLAENRKMLGVLSHTGLPSKKTRDGSVVEMSFSLQDS